MDAGVVVEAVAEEDIVPQTDKIFTYAFDESNKMPLLITEKRHFSIQVLQVLRYPSSRTGLNLGPQSSL